MVWGLSRQTSGGSCEGGNEPSGSIWGEFLDQLWNGVPSGTAVMCMRSAPLWDFTQRRMVVPYRRFGTTYRYHLQGSKKEGNGRWEALSFSRRTLPSGISHAVRMQNINLLRTIYPWAMVRCYCLTVAYRGGSTPPPPPKFPSFYKVEPYCKLSGKCLVLIF